MLILILYNNNFLIFLRYGTTDTTRVFHFGKPSKKNREIYTRVLKGNLNVEKSILSISDKHNTNSSDFIDSLARSSLIEIGLNFGHSTGHGVGHFLNVHERGASISPISNKPFEEGFVVSNEPGCYIENEFGVRIENVLACVKSTLPNRSNDNDLVFENLTYYPYEIELINKYFLEETEINLINNYHAYLKKTMSEFLLDKENYLNGILVNDSEFLVKDLIYFLGEKTVLI